MARFDCLAAFRNRQESARLEGAMPKRTKPQELELEPAGAEWIGRLVDDAAKIRLRSLFEASREGAVYRVPDRSGIGVVALPTSGLGSDELLALMRYRLAQYLESDFVDGRVVYEQRLEHEPVDAVSGEDIHIVAGSPETGELFCYSIVEAPPEAPAETRMRDRDRPLFPVEQVHGSAIYNRLRILPDLEIAKVRELGRFVRNQRLPPVSDAAVRAPIEVFLAACRMITGSLAMQIDAMIGDFEEAIVKHNLEFFHVPMVVLHGTVPYVPEGKLLYPRYQYRTVYPFACLALDGVHALSRLDAIDEALSQPGTLGLIELMRAREEGTRARSSLEPPEGLPELADTPLPQEGVRMEARRDLRETGARLQTADLFSGLSDSEAAILGSCMGRVEARAGEVVVRQGEVGDALFLIEEGMAEVVRRPRDDGPGRLVAELGPGDYFGEIAIVTGGERIADVIAQSPMVLRRLSKDDYVRFLSGLADVERSVTATGLTRAGEAAREPSPQEEPT
jgi:Cyclic nucleotide-binding domain